MTSSTSSATSAQGHDQFHRRHNWFAWDHDRFLRGHNWLPRRDDQPELGSRPSPREEALPVSRGGRPDPALARPRWRDDEHGR